MDDMTFTALIAMGMTDYSGAVLSVDALNAEVRKVVLADIDEDGDREFINALGDGIPASGLLKVHAELLDWPGEYEYGQYRLISVSPVALTS